MISFRSRIFLSSLWVCAFTAGAHAVSAQDLPPLSSEYAPGTLPRGAGSLPFSPPIVLTGKPFHAEYNSRRVEPGPGGLVTHEYHGIVARDSEGRFLRETVYPHSDDVKNTGRGETEHVFSVSDTVANVNLSWDDGPLKRVMKNNIPPRPPMEQPLDVCERAKADPRFGRTVRGQTATAEDLGERNIQGIVARGCRMTTVITDSGNTKFDVPYTITDETWASPDLRVTLSRVHTDPHGMNSIERLDNVVREDPDPRMFQPPDAYKVDDMSAKLEEAKARGKAESAPIVPTGPKPLMIAGAWETVDPILGLGTRIGIFLHVQASREIQMSQGTVVGEGAGTFTNVQFQFYQRTAGDEHGIWFTAGGDTTQYMSASWDGQRLQAKFKFDKPSQFAHPDFALDLTFNSLQQNWSGDYTREGVTKQIHFERPSASGSAASPLVGIWSMPGSQMGGSIMREGCIQITRTADGEFMAWSISSNLARFITNGVRSPMLAMDDAGQRWGITFDNGTVTLDQATYMGGIAGALPRKFIGKISDDGSQISGHFAGGLALAPGENGDGQPTAIMKKTSADSCVQTSLPQRQR